MKLRWLIICDKYGQKTEPMLQFKEDDDTNMWGWEYVETKEIKSDEDESLT